MKVSVKVLDRVKGQTCKLNEERENALDCQVTRKDVPKAAEAAAISTVCRRALLTLGSKALKQNQSFEQHGLTKDIELLPSVQAALEASRIHMSVLKSVNSDSDNAHQSGSISFQALKDVNLALLQSAKLRDLAQQLLDLPGSLPAGLNIISPSSKMAGYPSQASQGRLNNEDISMSKHDDDNVAIAMTTGHLLPQQLTSTLLALTLQRIRKENGGSAFDNGLRESRCILSNEEYSDDWGSASSDNDYNDDKEAGSISGSLVEKAEDSLGDMGHQNNACVASAIREGRSGQLGGALQLELDVSDCISLQSGVKEKAPEPDDRGLRELLVWAKVAPSQAEARSLLQASVQLRQAANAALS
ncbi:hypothetical protein CEUSTIGMA_g5345.t1 [Chlamydomonas eustigma]|uniref:Uncharacterized protein n=1 Tax=Chlamydomonas eustigma TaxID=1157962 RepID=A0A250X4A0_9CHLO|nr:hypothetical protein CEUSTIGMA_g5345.t1 [Chlamydomonas eustigma]|eukprot:GAX77903.1 hypothetical protein CEUSTIGMA_g5345.t1 [Chlamydomonas eustigma]